ncbi:hypothetical protein EG68_08627 [Paragonimus skrjabini miyazakii]|uniref:STIL N-terminal domain-containing protein n=1 Tax=Paragonimus skrjabini miyazakii TaxID=59628 RepID=A0A8S9YA34_9TREM|nr:hypothetical protein EG68_08627 [Paragonimus skrjabini miyazakii]
MHTLIWNRNENGTAFTSTFLQSRCLRLKIPKNVINLIRQLFQQVPDGGLQTYLVAKFCLSDANCLQLVVDRIEYPYHHELQLSCLNEETTIPIRFFKHEQTEPYVFKNLDGLVQSIWSRSIQQSPSLEMNDLLVFKAIGYPIVEQSPRGSYMQVDGCPAFCLRVDAVSVDCMLLFKPIQTLPMINSALTRSLETNLICPASLDQSNNSLYSALDLQFGYISMKDSTLFSLHLDSDPSVMSANIAGMWISGIEFVDDPRVWALCFRFLVSSRISRRCFRGLLIDDSCADALHIPGVSMFLLFYGSVPGQPTCFEVDLHNESFDSSLPSQSMNNSSRVIQFNLHTHAGNIRPVPKLTDHEWYTLDLELATKEEHLLSLMNNAISQLNPPIPQLEKTCITSTDPTVRSWLPEPSLLPDSSVTGTISQSSLHHLNTLNAQFNVPDASLLIEEGVAISNAHLLEKCKSLDLYSEYDALFTVEKHAEDGIPRELPCSPISLVHDTVKPDPVSGWHRLSTIKESDCSQIAYDSGRYQPPTKVVPNSPGDHELQTRNNNTPGRSVDAPANKWVSSKSGHTTLHSLLATLPPTQLKRLEQVISSLLKQAGRSENNDDTSRPGAHSDSVGTNVQAVDAGVNTTQYDLRYPLSRIDPEKRIHKNVKLEKSYESRLVLTNSDKESTHTQPVETSYSDACLANGKLVNHVEDIVETASHRVPYQRRKTLAELAPLLSLAPKGNTQSASALNFSEQAPEPHDKFSHLLSSIQVVLERRSKDDRIPINVPNNPRTNPQVLPTHSESICDYPLDRICLMNPARSSSPHTVSESALIRNTHGPLWQPAVAAAEAERQERNNNLQSSTAHDRVTHWLRVEQTESNMLTLNTQVNAAGLADTLDSQFILPTHDDNMEDTEVNSQANCTLSSSLISANMADYQSLLTQEPRITNIVTQPLTSLPEVPDCTTETLLPTDTDQSLFLATLVEKYLGLKINVSKRTDDRLKAKHKMIDCHSTNDVTRYGGLNPSDISWATQDYLKRHGILNVDSGRTGTPYASSTPVHGLSFSQHKTSRLRDVKQTRKAGVGSGSVPSNMMSIQPPTSISCDTNVPNILDGLCLERSPLVDTFTGPTLPILTETSSLCSEFTDLPEATDSPPSDSLGSVTSSANRILDMERIRSLPKLL